MTNDIDKVLLQSWNIQSEDVVAAMNRVKAYCIEKTGVEHDMPLYDIYICIGALELLLLFTKKKP